MTAIQVNRRRVKPHVYVWRYVSGNWMDGRRRTNRTAMQRGTMPKAACNWWNRKPRLATAGWRDIPPILAITLLVSWVTAHYWLFAMDLLLILVLGVPRVRVIYHEFRDWWHRQFRAKRSIRVHDDRYQLENRQSPIDEAAAIADIWVSPEDPVDTQVKENLTREGMKEHVDNGAVNDYMPLFRD
jgi:hypothetical protein